MVRSRVDEAHPVVSGKADDANANIVFAGWRTNPELQGRFNPFVELTEAAKLRDAILHRFLLKPGHIVGYPTQERAQLAQLSLMVALVRQRRWGRNLIDRYFGIEIPDTVWASLYARAVV